MRGADLGTLPALWLRSAGRARNLQTRRGFAKILRSLNAVRENFSQRRAICSRDMPTRCDLLSVSTI